jgi:hypothetical protein
MAADTPIELTEQQVEHLSDILSLNFRPAQDPGEATQFLTTDQLFKQVNDHSPGLLPIELFREAMLKCSFIEHYNVDGFVWLLSSAH